MRSKTTPTIVRSTTRRPPRAPVQERRSDVLLPTYLAWVREQPCVIEVQDAATCASRAVQPHHWPTTGANGRQVDTLVLPACWACHRACHTGAVPGETQEAAAWRSWARFWRFAPVAVQRQVARELAASLDA